MEHAEKGLHTGLVESGSSAECDNKANVLFGSKRIYVLSFLCSVIIYFLPQYYNSTAYFSHFSLFDHDDAMRFLSVRDLLAGQSWFDTRQYRVLPPEGISIHWSRLIDAPLAALILLFSISTPYDLAEKVAGAVWPAFLFLIFLVLTGKTARSAFGTSAASFAIMAASILPILVWINFSFGRVDHHNVQILAMLGICAALIMQGKPWLSGLIAGITAAFSLAIGLETIFYVTFAGVFLATEYCIHRPGASQRLTGFGLGLGFTAPLFYAAQTPLVNWTTATCDTLSPPLLAVTTGATASALVLHKLSARIERPILRMMLTLVVGVICLIAAYPAIGECLRGPYAHLPAELQNMYILRIGDLQPAYQMLMVSPVRTVNALIPFIITIVLCIWLLIRERRAGADTEMIRSLLLVTSFLFFGFLCTLFQVRFITMAAAVLPLAIGVAFSILINEKWSTFRKAKPFVLVVLAVSIVMPGILTLGGITIARTMNLLSQDVVHNINRPGFGCLHPTSIAELNSFSSARIISPISLSASILLYTEHSLVSSGYHRSVQAMENGVYPFYGTEDHMKKIVDQFDVDIVVLCTNEIYGTRDSFGSLLASGKEFYWLEKLYLGKPAIRAYRVLQSLP